MTNQDLNDRVTRVEERFDAIESRLGRLENGQDRLSARVDHLAEHLGGRIDHLHDRFTVAMVAIAGTMIAGFGAVTAAIIFLATQIP